MDDYADIYYVDNDPRNARDHRTSGGGSSRLPWRPVAPPTRTVYVPPSAQAPIAHGQMVHAGQAPIYYAQPLPQQQSPFGTLFGKLTAGQAIELVTQIFAALQPLPAAPVPTRSGDTDSGNLVTLCRARHKVIYAACRIMPRASGLLDEVEAHRRGMIRAPSSLRRVAG